MSYPQLFEDHSRNDWAEAEYSSDVDIDLRTNRVSVEHSLEGCPQLQALIDSKKAAWRLEIRSPRTLFSTSVLSYQPLIEATWNPSDVLASVFFFSGLYALDDIELTSDGLSEVWAGAKSIKIPKGSLLIRSKAFANYSEIASILKFRRTESSSPGAMEVSENTASGSLEFIVHMAADLFDHMRHDRTVQIAALIAALSHLKRKEWDEPDPAYKQLKHFFEENELPPWDDDAFDPAKVATMIEPFRPDLAYVEEAV